MQVLLYDQQREILKESIKQITTMTNAHHSAPVDGRRGSDGDLLIKSFLEEESFYLRALDTLVQNFLWRLKVYSKLGNESLFIDCAKIADIFSNIEDIRDLTRKLYTELEERSYYDISESVSLVFSKYASHFRMYSLYVSNFESALQTSRELRKSSMFFKTFMETNEISEGISFEELLELPVKRIDQYLHCLKMIREYVCQRHSNLRRVYDETFLKFLGYWNFVKLPSSSIRKRMEVAELQEKQFGGSISLVSPTRYLLYQGALQKRTRTSRIRPNREKDFIFFLFNDILIYVEQNKKNRFKFKHSIGLHSLKVLDMLSEGDCSFKLEGSGVAGGSMTLTSNHPDEKKLWMNSIMQASKLYTESNKYSALSHSAIESEINRKSSKSSASMVFSASSEKWSCVQTDLGVPYFYELGTGRTSLNMKNMPDNAEQFRKRIDIMRGKVCYISDCPQRALVMNRGYCIDHAAESVLPCDRDDESYHEYARIPSNETLRRHPGMSVEGVIRAASASGYRRSLDSCPASAVAETKISRLDRRSSFSPVVRQTPRPPVRPRPATTAGTNSGRIPAISEDMEDECSSQSSTSSTDKLRASVSIESFPPLPPPPKTPVDCTPPPAPELSPIPLPKLPPKRQSSAPPAVPAPPMAPPAPPKAPPAPPKATAEKTCSKSARGGLPFLAQINAMKDDKAASQRRLKAQQSEAAVAETRPKPTKDALQASLLRAIKPRIH